MASVAKLLTGIACRAWFALTVCVAAMAFSSRAHADGETVQDIVVETNTKTTAPTVILVSGIRVGDPWSIDLIDKAKRNMESCGLFKEEDAYFEAVPGGVRVHLVAVDKFSWVIAPTFYNQPTNKGGGIGYGENNLFGKNGKLLLYGQLATGDSLFVAAFIDPSIAGSRFHWEYDLFLKSSHSIEYASPRSWRDNPTALRTSRLNYLDTGANFGVNIWKFALDAKLRGAYVYYRDVQLADGATLAQVTGDSNATALPAPGNAGYDISGALQLKYDDRATWYGLSTGHKLLVNFEQALPALGSNFNYWDINIQGQIAQRYLERHNLIMKAMLNIGHDLPFQQEFLTGGTSMRGWLNAQFRGDFQAQTNIEYSVPLFSVGGLGVRGLGFWDSAYTTFLDPKNGADNGRSYLPGAAAGGFAPYKNSLGVGFRLYLRQLVLPLLGFDVGYGLESGEIQAYVAIGLTD